MSANLFQKAWRITVDTLELQQVDVSFNVKKTLKPEPNSCDLKIYNLNPDHRKQIEQNPALNKLKKVPVKIEAGYGTSLAQIFLGDLRAGWTVTDGADLITELSTGDAEKSLATARVNVSLGPGTSIDTVLREIVKTLGVGDGNIQKVVSVLQAKGLAQFSTKGVVLKGNAADHLSDLMKSNGMEWSVQDGAFQGLDLGQPLAGQALDLSSDTGLIGSPSVDSKGVLNGMALMIPGIKPGAVVYMNSRHIPPGGYRISTCEYSGDTLGNDWTIKFQAEKY